MKKYLMLFIKMILCGCFFLACNCGEKKIENNRILYFSIYPQSKTSQTYTFEIFKNKRMNTKVGKRNFIVSYEVEYVKIKNEKSTILSNSDFEKILNIVEKLEKYKSMEIEGEVWDNWEIIAITENKRFHRYQDNYSNCDKDLYELYLVIKKISPFDIAVQNP